MLQGLLRPCILAILLQSLKTGHEYLIQYKSTQSPYLYFDCIADTILRVLSGLTISNCGVLGIP
jgi:hypothetical protein